jgi:hypothetical protein
MGHESESRYYNWKVRIAKTSVPIIIKKGKKTKEKINLGAEAGELTWWKIETGRNIPNELVNINLNRKF